MAKTHMEMNKMATGRRLEFDKLVPPAHAFASGSLFTTPWATSATNFRSSLQKKKLSFRELFCHLAWQLITWPTYPKISMCWRSQQLNLSFGTLTAVLKDDLRLHVIFCKIKFRWKITFADRTTRGNMCNWFSQQMNANEDWIWRCMVLRWNTFSFKWSCE